MALCWNRSAQDEELKTALNYIRTMLEYHHEHEPVRMEYPRAVHRKMFEEMTGEPFEYVEQLEIFKHYTADKKDLDVSVGTRALADLLVVFFNTNEFMYVY